jgi:hypothetical protein
MRHVPAPGRLRQIFELGVLLLSMALAPLLLRSASPPETELPPSYLPALEARRERRPFDADGVRRFRELQPAFVFIGDSMVPSRIDWQHLQRRLGEPVTFIQRHSTGSAYWYLGFKNHLVASGVQPKRVFIFFRDTQLTDPLFRLTGGYREVADEVARDDEPELDRVLRRRLAGEWAAVDAALDRLYGASEVWTRATTVLQALPARLVSDRPAAFQDAVNARFDLEFLRPYAAADIGDADVSAPEFSSAVDSSVLPDLLDLAARAGVPLAFVRVQRRPGPDGRPPADSPALARYLADLGAYIEARGAKYHDFTGDPGVTLAMYGDGDHIAREHRQAWTDLFVARLGGWLR